MQALQLLGCLHALLLISLSWRSAVRLTAGTVHRLCAAFLLEWSNLVCTGLILATFSRLNSVGLYFSTSVALGCALEFWLALRKTSPLPAGPKIVEDRGGRFDQLVRWALAATLGFATLASLLICWHFVPNNWDTCTYRFSRVFFYLSQGNLLHFGATFDQRLLYYPLNGVLAYIFLALYQFGAQWMYLVTGLAWIFAGLGIYLAARGLGASHTGSVVAAWLGVMSPNVLAQATATTDEVLAATPILIGVSFGMAWFSTSRRRYAVLAGLGIGLGGGTKLHWTFYWVFVLAAVISLALYLRRKPEARQEFRRRVPDALLAGCVALPLLASFVVCNYMSSGMFMHPGLAEANLNRPFRLDIAREKIRINTAQLFLNPIPDLVPPVRQAERQIAYASFNQFFMKCCFADLVETPKPSRSGYRFTGLVKPDGFSYSEYSVWLGFLPHLLVLAGLVGVFTRKLRLASLAFLASFFFWHATDSVQNLYIDDVAAYYSFPAVIAIAGLAPAWDFATDSRRLSGRLLLAAFFAVFATHLVLGANLLRYGGLRNIMFLSSKPAPPADMHPVDPGVIHAIQSARQIYIPYTHWEVLYWNYMRFNPAARYRTGEDLHAPTSGDAMLLLDDLGDPHYDLVPVRLPKGTVQGLSYLGTADHNVQVFAGNGTPAVRASSGPGYYAVVPFTETVDNQTGAAELKTGRHWSSEASADCCLGLERSDQIEVRYELQSTTSEKQLVHEWLLPGRPDSGLSFKTDDGYDMLVIETRSVKHPDEVVRTVHRLGDQAYVIGGNENIHAGNRPLTVNVPLTVKIPALAPEPYDLKGNHYSVSWLKEQTQFSVINSGKEVQATLELQLATFGKPRTAQLLSAGRVVGVPFPVSHIFWENGAETVRFTVRLMQGENKFVLASKEAPSDLPDGRHVCFLLIGDITAVSTSPALPDKHEENRPLMVKTQALAPEPYDLKGKHYSVNWLKQETQFSVINPGNEAQGTIELQLATFGKPRTAELLSAGRVIGRPFPISHIFWENGAETVRFSVRLEPGENKFVLASKETPSGLPDRRQVCFLLIGDITAVSALSGKS
jgi:hypothetical protein